MKHTIIISSPELARRAMDIIDMLPEATAVHEVVIREHKRDRSAAQNSLLWKWYTAIAEELGEQKEEIHERYKAKFLVNIYRRDDPDYAEMFPLLRAVWDQGLKDQAARLRKKIVALTSTTKANVKQMAEFLTCIERDAIALNIRLPHPEDYHEAMGSKEK